MVRNTLTEGVFSGLLPVRHICLWYCSALLSQRSVSISTRPVTLPDRCFLTAISMTLSRKCAWPERKPLMSFCPIPTVALLRRNFQKVFSWRCLISCVRDNASVQLDDGCPYWRAYFYCPVKKRHAFLDNLRKRNTFAAISGVPVGTRNYRGVAQPGLEYASGGRVVAGSNPVTPTEIVR